MESGLGGSTDRQIFLFREVRDDGLVDSTRFRHVLSLGIIRSGLAHEGGGGLSFLMLHTVRFRGVGGGGGPADQLVLLGGVRREPAPCEVSPREAN